jgi:hypothetical protein
MFKQLGTPENRKKEIAFPDVGDHVIASSITSKNWENVLFSTIDFLENIAKVPAKPAYQETAVEVMTAKEMIKKIN